MINFSIKNDFSEYCGGRFRSISENSAEQLRDRYLIPLLNKAMVDDVQLVIDMSGTSGMCSSFIEEAFGGLIRAGFCFMFLKRTLVLLDSEMDLYDKRAWEYIEEEYDRLIDKKGVDA